MSKFIAVLSLVALMICSCGDKITNVTYVNGYYSCVGTWTYVGTDHTKEVLTFNSDKTWKLITWSGIYVDTTLGVLWVQNNSDITLYNTSLSNQLGMRVSMIDSSTVWYRSNVFTR